MFVLGGALFPTICRSAPPETRTILALGDSLTAGQGGSDPHTRLWPALLGAALGYTVIDRGAGGVTTPSIAALNGACGVAIIRNGNGIVSISPTPIDGHDGRYHRQSPPARLRGMIDGIPTYLVRTSDDRGVSRYMLDPFPPGTGDVVFLADPPSPAGTTICFICASANDAPDQVPVAVTLHALAQMVTWAKARAYIPFVYGLTTASPLEALIERHFGGLVARDAQGRNLHERLSINSDGLVPAKLLSAPGSVHLNDAGYVLWASHAREALIRRGIVRS